MRHITLTNWNLVSILGIIKENRPTLQSGGRGLLLVETARIQDFHSS
jgi:hypothetical protein